MLWKVFEKLILTSKSWKRGNKWDDEKHLNAANKNQPTNKWKYSKNNKTNAKQEEKKGNRKADDFIHKQDNSKSNNTNNNSNKRKHNDNKCWEFFMESFSWKIKV